MPGGARPDGMVWHVNGPIQGGWCVADAWTSKASRDRFMERTSQIIAKGPLTGAPTIDEMEVQASMRGAAAAHA